MGVVDMDYLNRLSNAGTGRNLTAAAREAELSQVQGMKSAQDRISMLRNAGVALNPDLERRYNMMASEMTRPGMTVRERGLAEARFNAALGELPSGITPVGGGRAAPVDRMPGINALAKMASGQQLTEDEVKASGMGGLYRSAQMAGGAPATVATPAQNDLMSALRNMFAGGNTTTPPTTGGTAPAATPPTSPTVSGPTKNIIRNGNSFTFGYDGSAAQPTAPVQPAAPTKPTAPAATPPTSPTVSGPTKNIIRNGNSFTFGYDGSAAQPAKVGALGRGATSLWRSTYQNQDLV